VHQSIVKGTLLEVLCSFSALYQLPLKGTAWSFISGSACTFATCGV